MAESVAKRLVDHLERGVVADLHLVAHCALVALWNPVGRSARTPVSTESFGDKSEAANGRMARLVCTALER